jgi:glycosyltransferase involved in cell wall biosynthesis
MAAQFGSGRSPESGHRAASGDFIAFLDADDLWHPEKLSRQMARFQARPELNYCVAYVQNFWIPELIEEEAKFHDHRIAKPLPGYVTGTLLARGDFFNAVGPFDAAINHADDTDWFLRAEDLGGVMELLPEVLLYRRLHTANLSHLKASRSRDQYLHVLKTALDRRRLQKKAPG